MTEEEKKALKYARIKQTMIDRYGEDYYSKIGSVSGKKSNNRPFRDNPELASRAGKKSNELRRKKSDK